MTKKTPPATSPAAIPGVDQCVALLKAGRLEQFEASARQLAARYPKAAKPLQLIGVAALMRGRLQEAVDSLQAAARLDQTDASIWENLGVALQRAGHHLAAADAYQGSVRLAPEVPTAWVNASSNFAEMGSYVLARNLAFRATQLAPRLPEAWANLGNALRLLGDLQDAVRALLKAVDLDSRCVPAHMGLARAMASRGGAELALKHARKALEVDPNDLDSRLTHALLCGFADQVVDICRFILNRRPGDLTTSQLLLFALLADHRADVADHLEAARLLGSVLAPRYQGRRLAPQNRPEPDRQLKLAFLSGDLRLHAVADHVAPLWRGLDRKRVEIHAYYTHAERDQKTAELQALADYWTDAAGLTDEQIAEHMRARGIDILIDLAGHTDFNRIGVLLLKPAPLQMHWIGYVASLGLDCVDYYIADPVMVPPGAESQFVEKLIRLPILTNQDGPGEQVVAPLPALLQRRVTFGTTARADKINADVVALWARVLQRQQNAGLVMVLPVEDSRQRILGQFAAQGIGPERLEILPHLSGVEYLALHNRIDILLDTFPYSGGTVVTNALWMGVPTVTLAGQAVQQRLAAARLASVGLQDWVAESADEFVELAVTHADNLPGLAALRQGLRQRLIEAPLRQEAAFAAAFEGGLRQAWQRWCAGAAPAHIEVAPQDTKRKRASRARKPRAATTD